MDRGAWWATVHGVTKRQTQLNDFHFHPLSLYCVTNTLRDQGSNSLPL